MEAVAFEKYSFLFDPMGEEIENLGYDVDSLMSEESPLSTLEEAWDDRAIRRRYPDAFDAAGEVDAAFVLGRLTALFGSVALEEGEMEGVGFLAPFVVYRAGDEQGGPVAVATAFARLDQSVFTCISLDEGEAPAEAVAREYWSLLFSNAEDLEEEVVRVLNPETEGWIYYGVTEGKAFVREESAEEEELEELEEKPYGQDRYDYDDDEEEDEGRAEDRY